MEYRAPDAPSNPIIRPGDTCWRLERADRLAWLIDGAAYYAAVKRALFAAREQVFIIGWDFDSRILLERCEPMPGVPDRLRDLLIYIAERRPSLSIRILLWDFTILFASTREPLPALTFAWKTPPNVELVLDDCVPFGASHHGKAVIVDDRLAFVGGMDIAEGRWDTPAHRKNDPHRVDGANKPYQPTHDVQVMFDGDAAAAVGEYARARWQAATGRRIRPPTGRSNEDPWPEGVSPDLRRCHIGIARTSPAMNGNSEIREVERLYLASIAAARELIFIENQYFTSEKITEALAQRLAEPDGPELLMILPQSCHGWLEELTMDTRRAVALHRLQQADAYQRLRVLGPLAHGEAVHVHAKTMTIDDRFARVGSSNLNNRSIALDTELDICIEDNGDGRVGPAVATLRNRLIAEHLGTSPDIVAEAHAAQRSLVRAVDELRKRGNGLTLAPIEVAPETDSEAIRSLAALIDSERQIDLAELELRIIPDELQPDPRDRRPRHVFGAVVALLVLVSLAAMWSFTPLSETITPDAVGAWMESIRASPLTAIYVIAAYALLGLVCFPITLLITMTAIVFDPVTAFGYAAAGALVSAAAGFGVGLIGGRRLIRRIAGRRIKAINRFLRRQGIIAVAALRVVPIVPFTVLNIALGASRVRFLDYAFGTMLGMLPGIALLSLLGHRVEALWRNPSWTNGAIAIGILAGWGALGFAVQRLVALWHTRQEKGSGGAQ